MNKNIFFHEYRRLIIFFNSLFVFTLLFCFTILCFYRIPIYLIICFICISALFLTLFNTLYIRKFKLSNNLQTIYEQTFPASSQESGSNVIQLQKILDDWLAFRSHNPDTNYVSKYLFEKSELKALQSQINPHFLFNTLECMRGYAYRYGQNELAEIAEAMSSLFRNCLTDSEELITVYDEMENIKNYLMIQQFRFSNRLKVNLETGFEDVKIIIFLI